MLDVLSLEDKKRLFEKELQKFAYDIEILCALESGGKLEANEAYRKIKVRWKKLKRLKKDLSPKEAEIAPVVDESLPQQEISSSDEP